MNICVKALPSSLALNNSQNLSYPPLAPAFDLRAEM